MTNARIRTDYKAENLPLFDFANSLPKFSRNTSSSCIAGFLKKIRKFNLASR